MGFPLGPNSISSFGILASTVALEPLGCIYPRSTRLRDLGFNVGMARMSTSGFLKAHRLVVRARKSVVERPAHPSRMDHVPLARLFLTCGLALKARRLALGDSHPQLTRSQGTGSRLLVCLDRALRACI